MTKSALRFDGVGVWIRPRTFKQVHSWQSRRDGGLESNQARGFVQFVEGREDQFGNLPLLALRVQSVHQRVVFCALSPSLVRSGNP